MNLDLEVIRSALGWCSVINLAIVLLWAGFLLMCGDWMYRFHSRFVSLSRERYNAIHFGGLVAFELAIMIFNVTPYLALRIVF